MTSETPENPFFRPPRESTLADDEVRSQVRAEFYDIQSRFVDRLACACVFDRERFEALLLWLDTLRRCYAAADLPMLKSDFDQFSKIATYLELEATHSKEQREECIAAHTRWLSIMRDYQQLPEQKS
jgi:hypothetical protein